MHAGDRCGSTAAGVSGAPSVSVISTDQLVRAGLTVALTQPSLRCVHAVDADHLDDSSHIAHADYVVLHVAPREGRGDAFSLIDEIPALKEAATTAVVAITQFSPSLLITLRLAEAGTDFVLPYVLVSQRPNEFATAMGGSGLSEHRRLPSQWALREQLGLRWNGALAPFVAHVRSLPTDTWRVDRVQSALPISRSELREVCQMARDIAGLPPPDFRKYANSTRRAPELPEWATVRDFARELLGLPRV